MSRPSASHDRRDQFAFSFHVRFALAVGTLVLASLLLAAPFNHRGLRGLIAFAASFAYLALLHTCEALAVSRTALPPVAARVAAEYCADLRLQSLIASSSSSRLRGSFSSAQ